MILKLITSSGCGIRGLEMEKPILFVLYNNVFTVRCYQLEQIMHVEKNSKIAQKTTRKIKH